MNHKLKALLLPCLILILCPAFANAAVTLLEKDDWKVFMTGFVEFDSFYDTTRSFTEVVGSNPVAYGGPNHDNGRTQFSVRNSRLAFGVNAPNQGDWKTRGYLEMDFMGFDLAPAASINTEAGYFNNPTLRIRHAYLAGENSDGWQVLVGQYWTLFGWQPYYILTTASVAPVTGTTYERTPQVTLLKGWDFTEQNKFLLGLSIKRPVQRDSTYPGVDLGARFTYGELRSGFASASGDVKPEPLSLAVSGTFQQFATPSGTTTVNQPGSAIAVDTLIPVIPASEGGKETGNSLSLSGEFTTGTGYGDQFPGWTGGLANPLNSSANAMSKTVNLDAGYGDFDPTGAFQLVHLQTWNAQLQYHLPPGWNTFIDVSYGQLYANNVYNLVSAAQPYNRTEVYTGNLFHDLSKQIRVAAEFDHFVTTYADGNIAPDNRYQVSAWYRF